MIQKYLFTVWLSDNPQRPELINKCIASQKIEGYSHHVITLDNCDKRNLYVQQAIANRNWVKAADYVRMEYMYHHGGIYLDADMEVLQGKNFDDLLHHKLFTYVDCGGMYANMGFGAEVNHPLVKAYLDRVDANYKGNGDLVFEPGIRTWTDILWAGDKSTFDFIEPEIFCPYNHITGVTNITDKTKVNHYYTKSWLTKSWQK